jgi:large subunit ribosomal protein L23
MTFVITTQQQRRFKLIKRPHISEKTTNLADNYRQFVFEVDRNANKSEVKQAVESLFNVKVSAVQLLNVKPKSRRFKQIEGHIKAWKKAYVRLEAGHDIDFTGTK